jgi:ubiquinone/menaquinone biosynthesis C-methylase UbiE
VAVEFAQTVYTHLPLADSSFDRVLCSFGMHRLAGRELRLLLGEARRVLKPGGELHTTGVIRAAGPGPLPHWAAAAERTMRIWLDVAGFDAVTSHGDMPLPDGTVEFVSARKPATQ